MKLFNGLSILGIAAMALAGVGSILQQAADERRMEQMIDEKLDERLAEKNEENEEDE